MKHTPGPWAAHNDGLVTAGPRGLHIAQTATVGMGHAAAANARLIAAAPAMLLALQTIANVALMDKGHWAKTIEAEAVSAINQAIAE